MMKLARLSIATFNLYNLNEPTLPVYTDADGWSQEEYDRKIEWTARNIRQMKPDILGLQELWHKDSIRSALDASGVAEEYEILAPENATGKGIVCAALVRKGLRIGEAQWIVSFPEKFILQSSGDDPQTPDISVKVKKFSRPVLHFKIKPREEIEETHVYVCHFKSKGPTKVFKEKWFRAEEAVYKKHQTNLGSAISTIRRAAEASALRFMLSEQMKETRTGVIVLGDINDSQHSNTVNILTEQPRYLVGDSVGGGDTSLYTAQTLQEYRNTRDVYYTHIHQDIMESLDHILVSEEFYDNSRKRVWLFDGMTIANDHLNSDDHKQSGTNDHGIICASFKFRPMKAEAARIIES